MIEPFETPTANPGQQAFLGYGQGIVPQGVVELIVELQLKNKY